jgi:hypothetical protein
MAFLTGFVRKAGSARRVPPGPDVESRHFNALQEGGAKSCDRCGDP